VSRLPYRYLYGIQFFLFSSVVENKNKLSLFFYTNFQLTKSEGGEIWFVKTAFFQYKLAKRTKATKEILFYLFGK